MAKKLEVGMWCWITNCVMFPENNGKPVVIKEFMPNQELGRCWMVEGSGLYGHPVSGRELMTKMWARSGQLIPINNPGLDVSDIDVVDIGQSREVEHVG